MFQLESPLYLLLLIPLVPFLAFWYFKSYADLSRGRLVAALVLRTLALTLIVVALSKPVLMLENSDRSVLFLVDISDSVPTEALENAWQQIQEHTLNRGSDERAGLVLFAGHPRLTIPPNTGQISSTPKLERKLFHKREKERARGRIQELERAALGDAEREELAQLEAQVAELESWTKDLATDRTDLEAACRMARGLLPIETRRRIVIYSDGNSNRGDLIREATALQRADFSAHAHVLRRSDEPEVIAEEVFLPAEAQVKAPFTVEFNIVSNVETEAVVKVYRNKYKVEEQALHLNQGRNLLKLDKVRLEEGFHQFECVVDAADDTVLQNNVARGVVRVSGRPKVLLVDRDVREARFLEQALIDEEIDVEVRPPSGVPSSMDDLLNYDVLILSDVPADKFAPGAMAIVKTYVRDMGGGLVMLGGEQSFGLGGYYRTPIEDALPVKMPVKKNVEKPNLALALVIDKSGSMNGANIELAKEAAIASAEVLKGNDRFGVVAFDARAEWITPMTQSSDSGVINSSISRLVAGGGTNIYPALHVAWQALLEEDTKLKHIILLSDGHTQGSGYDNLVGHIAADGITLSAVGIGSGADATLLGDMASWGGGEYYFTNDFASIPQIFTRETMRASKSMLVEEPFVPSVLEISEPLKGIDPQVIPFLLGYVATQPKELASVSMASDYGDPVLATWSYGLGRSAAFTSDAKTRWGGDWISWEAFGKFWGQLVRSVMSTGAHHELRPRTKVHIHQGMATVAIDVRDRVGAFRDDVTPEVSLVGNGDGGPSPLPISHVGPGLYEASFPIEEYGDIYRLLIVHKQAGEVVDIKAIGVTESYSPEFRTALPDEEALRMLADETGGTMDPDRDAVWRFDGAPARTPKDTWWWWLIAAALLLPLDIGLRRLGV